MAPTLTKLLEQSSIVDHDEIIRACKESYGKTNDVLIKHIELVALLKLDQLSKAQDLLGQEDGNLKQQAAFERAYVLYKTGNLREAIEVAAAFGSAKPEHRGIKHVEAQAAYRAEDFSRALSIYKELSAEPATTHEADDLRINLLAVEARLQLSENHDLSSTRHPKKNDLELFESTYNLACAAIERSDFPTAEVLLKRTADLCTASDELSVEEKVAELIPVHIQQLFVALKLEKHEAAAKFTEKINLQRIMESSTKKVAANNLIIASSPENPFQIHKQFYDVPPAADDDKLLTYQQSTWDQNARVIDLLVGKCDGLLRSTNKALSKSNLPSTSPSINHLSALNLAAQTKLSGNPEVVLNKAQFLLSQRPRDVYLVLIIVQLHAAAGRLEAAASLLRRFFARLENSVSEADANVRYNPGLLEVYTTLCNALGCDELARSELSQATSHWLQQENSPETRSLLLASGSEYLQSLNNSDSIKAQPVFDKLRELDPSNAIFKAGLVSAYSRQSETESKSDHDAFLPVQELIAGVNVAGLEEAGIPLLETDGEATLPSRKRPVEQGTEDLQRKKRIRKSRLPKDYDPNRQPDPERWLPLRDRSSYRPKGRKAKQRASERTQGGVVGEKDKEGAQSTGAPPAGQSQPKQASSSNQKKKKSKKGKW